MTDFFLLIVCVLMCLLTITLIFVLDDIVLNKHFTKKLHQKLGVK